MFSLFIIFEGKIVCIVFFLSKIFVEREWRYIVSFAVLKVEQFWVIIDKIIFVRIFLFLFFVMSGLLRMFIKILFLFVIIVFEFFKMYIVLNLFVIFVAVLIGFLVIFFILMLSIFAVFI